MEMVNDVVFFLTAAVATAVLTGAFRWWSLRRGVLDVPNARSSHSVPTPRGGGAAIAVFLLAVLVLLWAQGKVDVRILVACGAAGLMIAAIGCWDDHRSLPVRVRLGVHACAAAIVVLALSHDFISTVALPQLVTGAIVVLALRWSVNLYNFMDGIDGLAASQAIFISGAGWILGQESGSIWQTLAVATAGSSTGFLLWNWPPARI